MLNRIIKSSLVSFLSVLLSKLFVLVVNILVSRNSLAAEYGVFVLLRSMVNFFDTMLSSSISPVVLAKCSKSPDNISANKNLMLSIMQSFLLVFLFCVVLASVIIILGIDSVFLSFLPGVSIYQLSIVILLFLAMFINGVVTSIFLAKKRYLDLFVISLLSSATSLAFYYIAKEFEQNVASVGLLLMMLYQSIEVLAKLYFSTVDFRRIFENFRITRESRVGLKNNINFVMPLIFASTVNSVVFFYSRIWLSNQSNGLAELASFDVAFQFLIIQMLFLNTVTNVVIGYSKNINNENHQLLINIGLGALFSVVSWAFLYVFRDQLISIFGEGYSGYILPILTSASIFYAVAIAFNRKYVSTKHRKVLSVVSIVSSISMLVFMLNNAANAVNLSIGYIVYYVSSVVVYLLYFFGRSVFFVK
jgi:O-antigen/teichoic acid export membrane protein